MKSITNIVLFLFIIGSILAAGYIGFKLNQPQKVKEENVSVVIDKIEKVFKLVTVEASLAEIYDYKDYYTFDFSPFRKKALLRVNAKVSAGYDFEKITWQIDEDMKTITLKDFPDAEILSIDHELDYYDISQGTFNQFTKEDYNEINAKAKTFISAKATENKILEEAKSQKDEILSLISDLLASTGWTMVVEENPLMD